MALFGRWNWITEEEYDQDPARTYRGEDEAFFPLTQDGAKKLNIAKSGIGGLSSANNSVQIKRVNGLKIGWW